MKKCENILYSLLLALCIHFLLHRPNFLIDIALIVLKGSTSELLLKKVCIVVFSMIMAFLTIDLRKIAIKFGINL